VDFDDLETAARVGQAFWAEREQRDCQFFHVSCEGQLLGVISSKTGAAAIRKVLTPLAAQSFLGVWKPQGFEKLGPAFCMTSVDTLLFLLGQVNAAAPSLVHARIWQERLMLKRIPSVDSQIFEPRHWQLLRLFATGPQSMSDIVRSLNLPERVVRADLSSLYLVGCIRMFGAAENSVCADQYPPQLAAA
jgi:hypothetical protein